MPARYEFGHALIRHALYTQLNPDRRARLHLRTAQALEHGPVTDEQVVALATHYRLAGRFAAPERSIDYAVRAGEVACVSRAKRTAISEMANRDFGRSRTPISDEAEQSFRLMPNTHFG